MIYPVIDQHVPKIDGVEIVHHLWLFFRGGRRIWPIEGGINDGVKCK